MSPSQTFAGICRTGFVDIVMGVLARHAAVLVENDSDLPVDPLPRREPMPTRGAKKAKP